MEAAISEDAWYEEENAAEEVPVAEDEEQEPPALAEMRRIQTQMMGALSSHKEQWQAAHPGEIFDAVRPLTRGRSKLSEDERQRLTIEQMESKFTGKRWQERGPLNSDVSYWRGQARRTGAYGGQTRFSNRGGQNKEHFRQKAMRSEGHIDG